MQPIFRRSNQWILGLYSTRDGTLHSKFDPYTHTSVYLITIYLCTRGLLAGSVTFLKFSFEIEPKRTLGYLTRYTRIIQVYRPV